MRFATATSEKPSCNKPELTHKYNKGALGKFIGPYFESPEPLAATACATGVEEAVSRVSMMCTAVALGFVERERKQER